MLEIERVDVVSVPIRDADRAGEFYGDLLGLPPATCSSCIGDTRRASCGSVGSATIHVAIGTTARNGSEPVNAVRCLECGATRWTMFGATFEQLLDEPCEVCGGETVVERRRPGTGAARSFMERRDLEEHPRERV